MKAIKVVEPFKVEIVDVPYPDITDGYDVVVKVTSGGICGSDMGIWNGTNSLATYPRIIGHEFGGIVEEVGASVTKVKVGDKVAVDPVISCGHCYACKIGRYNVCSTLEVMGVHRDGGFAEYIKAPEDNMNKFNQEYDSSLLGIVEPYTIGMEINQRAQIKEGDQVLIMGAGPIGLCAMQIAKRNGATVIMTDLVKERLGIALKMGVDEVVVIGEDDLESRIAAFTDGEGIPIVVDTVCTPSSFEQSVQLACPAGRVVVIGLRNEPANITMADITRKGLTIVGSRLSCNCFGEVIAGFEDKSLNPEMLKTDIFHYTKINEALMRIKNHPQDVIKLVIQF